MAEISIIVDPDNGGGTDYTSLSAAEAAEQVDLVSAGDNIVFNCRSSSGTADTTRTEVIGWTTGVSNDIKIIGSDFPAAGIWNTGSYRLEVDAGGNNGVLEIEEEYVTVENLQVSHTGTSQAAWIIEYHGVGSSNQLYVNACILKGTDHASGVYVYTSTCNIDIENTLIYFPAGTTTGFSEGVHSVTANVINILNCTIYGMNDGIEGDGGTVTATNCLVFQNGTDFDGTITATYCASDDAKTGTGNFQITQTASDYAALVTDAANGDFSVTDDSSELYNAGTNTGAPDDDIIGTSRPQATTTDPGAFEFIVSGGLTLELGDTINISDALLKSTGLNKADSVSLSDTISKSMSISKSDIINLSDQMTKNFCLTKADTIILSDQINTLITLTLSLSDTITMIDSISKQPILARYDIISLSAAISFELIKSLTDNIILSDNLAKSFSTTKSDNITLIDQIDTLIALTLNLSDTITMADSISNLTSLEKSDTINMIGALSKVSEFARTFSDQIDMSDQTAKEFGITKADIINLSDEFSTSEEVIYALVNFLAKARVFNFTAKNRIFNFTAKDRGKKL